MVITTVIICVLCVWKRVPAELQIDQILSVCLYVCVVIFFWSTFWTKSMELNTANTLKRHLKIGFWSEYLH